MQTLGRKSLYPGIYDHEDISRANSIHGSKITKIPKTEQEVIRNRAKTHLTKKEHSLRSETKTIINETLEEKLKHDDLNQWHNVEAN